jgi:hypothetical protein
MYVGHALVTNTSNLDLSAEATGMRCCKIASLLASAFTAETSARVSRWADTSLRRLWGFHRSGVYACVLKCCMATSLSKTVMFPALILSWK